MNLYKKKNQKLLADLYNVAISFKIVFNEYS